MVGVGGGCWVRGGGGGKSWYIGKARGSVFVGLHHNAKCELQRHFFKIFSFSIGMISPYIQFNGHNFDIQ